MAYTTTVLSPSFFSMQVVPATKSTINLMGAKQFAAMKPDAILVNIARGVVSLAGLSFIITRSQVFFLLR